MVFEESGLASECHARRGAGAAAAERAAAGFGPAAARLGISPAGQPAVNRGAAPRRRAGRRVRSGFRPRSELLHRAYNSTLAGLLLVLALPVAGLIALLLLLTQGRPVLYRGDRVGQHGRLFGILKFRTLDTAAAARLTRDRVLPNGSGLETPLGGFLRETRLDELPQLLNVIAGDMNICGPRPVRPEIAEMQRAGIRNYDARFEVKPGLLGPAQALMGHGTPKAVRARLNAALCRAEVSYRRELGMMFIVPACMFARSCALLLARLAARAGLARNPQAAGDLAAKAGVSLQYRCAAGQRHQVLRIDDAHLVLDGCCAAGPGVVIITLPGGLKRRARVTAAAAPQAAGPGALRYSPASDYAHHILERYLYQRVVVPHHSHFVPGRALRALRRKIGYFAALPGSPTSSEHRARR